MIIASSISFAFSGTGFGTEQDPYLIKTLEHLNEIRDDLDACYELANDLDAAETEFSNDGKGFEPIGVYAEDDPSQAFTGIFDGRGHIISNLFIARPEADEVGFFGCVSDGARIIDLRFDRASVEGADYVGVLAGLSFPFSSEVGVLIEGCTVNGTVKGNNFVGILCGANFGVISYCEAFGVAEGVEVVGGLCGANYIGVITDSFSEASVVGNGYVGGFCGRNFASGQASIISKCYSEGLVEGKYEVGGFCGSNVAANEGSIGSISDCRSGADVSGDITAGGFCGSNGTSGCGEYTIIWAKLERCYSSGKVSGDQLTGGFCGTEVDMGGDADIFDCFWVSSFSEIPDNELGEPKSSEEMKLKITFPNWDFEETWCVDEGKSFPCIRSIEDCDNLAPVEMPVSETAFSAHPNPFSQFQTINYEPYKAGYVSLKLYDMLGNEVATLVDGFKPAGRHETRFDGAGLPCGTYFAILITDDNVVYKKLLIVD